MDAAAQSMERKMLMIRIIACFIFFLGASAHAAQDKIVAIVNKDTITQSDADAYLKVVILQLSQQYAGNGLENKIKEEKEQLISRMIEDKIILQEAKRKGLFARPDKVKSRIGQLKANYGSEIEFEDSLKEKGLTVKDLENKLNDQMIMREVVEREVRDKVVVSPDEVTRFYEKNKAELFLRPESRTVESLYFEDEAMAEKLEQDLKNGLDFQEAAKRYRCAYARDTVSRNELRPEVQERVFSLRMNEFSGPIKTEKGTYIFKLLDTHQPEIQSLSEAHSRVFNYLFEEKFSIKMLEWLEDLKSKAYIVVK